MIIVFALCAILLQQLIPILIERNAVHDAVRSAEQTIAEYKALREYYADNSIKKVLSKADLKMSSEQMGDSVAFSLVTAMFHDLSTRQDSNLVRIKLYSPFPFPDRESRQQDAFSQDAWEYIKSNPDKSYVRTVDKYGVQSVRVGMAYVMNSDTCVSCHNSHVLSPRSGWKLGDISGVLEVETDLTEQIENAHQLGNRITLMLLAMIVLTLLVTTWVFKIRVAKPLAGAAREAKRISEGDLKTYEQSFTNDEVGLLRSSLATMKMRLADVISGIRESAHGVSDSAEQASQGTQEQASSLEEVASTMEQMTEVVKQNAGNAAKAQELAADTDAIAKRSLVVVSSTIGAMASIENSNKKVSDIIVVIQNIAFQTNLLALNAAVEAARAGEHGRGFAVVASEVRELSGRCATAAKEIRELIDNSVSSVAEGSALIDETAEALSEITSEVANVSSMIVEIAAASKEQALGISQVNKAILQMDEMTQSNASLVEQAAAASEALGAQAEELTSLVAYFKLNNSGSDITRQLADSRRSIRKTEGVSSDTVLSKQRQPLAADDEWEDF